MMENDYIAMATRAAEFLESEATPENTVSWVYNNRVATAEKLRLCVKNNVMGVKAQRLVNSVWYYGGPLRRAWDRGDDAIARECERTSDSIETQEPQDPE